MGVALDLASYSGSGSIGGSGYHADLDLDFDGVTDATDTGIIGGRSGAMSTALPGGWIGDPSSDLGPDNSVGYAGYVFNPEREDYSVRFRVYSPELGRWRQRDPIGYADGASLINYVSNRTLTHRDPYGLQPGLGDNSEVPRPKGMRDSCEVGRQKCRSGCLADAVNMGPEEKKNCLIRCDSNFDACTERSIFSFAFPSICCNDSGSPIWIKESHDGGEWRSLPSGKCAPCDGVGSPAAGTCGCAPGQVYKVRNGCNLNISASGCSTTCSTIKNKNDQKKNGGCRKGTEFGAPCPSADPEI